MKIKTLPHSCYCLLQPPLLAQAQQLNIATYNLRYDPVRTIPSPATAGRLRYPNIAKIIRFNDLDIFGTQEGLYHQLTQLNDSLPGYKWLGAGRDDGQARRRAFGYILQV
jgi:hypothetical protein